MLHEGGQEIARVTGKRRAGEARGVKEDMRGASGRSKEECVGVLVTCPEII